MCAEHDHRTVAGMTRSGLVEPGEPRSRGWILDLGGSAVVTVALLVVSSHIPPAVDEREIDLFGYALLAAAGGAMALCRRLPAAALAVVTLALVAYVLADYPGGPIFLTGWFALVSLGWRRGRLAGIVGAAALCGALVAAAATEEGVEPPVFLVFVGWSAAAVLAGDVLRTRRERVAQLEERARQLERSRDEEARRQMAEERLRIARDIHDSVAHAMTTINVQAGAAAHVVDRRPAAARARWSPSSGPAATSSTSSAPSSASCEAPARSPSERRPRASSGSPSSSTLPETPACPSR